MQNWGFVGPFWGLDHFFTACRFFLSFGSHLKHWTEGRVAEGVLVKQNNTIHFNSLMGLQWACRRGYSSSFCSNTAFKKLLRVPPWPPHCRINPIHAGVLLVLLFYSGAILRLAPDLSYTHTFHPLTILLHNLAHALWLFQLLNLQLVWLTNCTT